MADTILQLGNPLAATLLSEELLEQAIYASVASKFIGRDEDSMIRVMPDLKRRPGDTIQYALEKKLLGAGVLGFDRLKGKEEQIQYLPDQFSINALAHAVNIVGEMTQQRVPWPMRKRARARLASWLKERMDVALLNQLGGNTNAGLGVTGVTAGDLRYAGMNAPIAIDGLTSNVDGGSGHWLAPPLISAESGLTSAGAANANVYSLYLINRAVTRAETLTFPIKPVIFDGEPYYVNFLHPYSINDLKSLTGEGTWDFIQSQILAGGKIASNPLFTGAIGMYNRTIIHKDAHVPFGDTTQMGAAQGTALGAVAAGTTSVARNIFCGAQAGVMAFGRKTEWPDQVKWVEVADDYMRELGVACEVVFGVKTSVFTDVGAAAASYFADIVISVWANTP